MKQFEIIEISSGVPIDEPFLATDKEQALEVMLEQRGFRVKEIPVDNDDTVTFICPECKGTRMECCEDGPYCSEITTLDEEGDFDYGPIHASGMVESYQCLNCGYVLANEDSSSIDDGMEVVEWCKENCEQD